MIKLFGICLAIALSMSICNADNKDNQEGEEKAEKASPAVLSDSLEIRPYIWNSSLAQQWNNEDIILKLGKGRISNTFHLEQTADSLFEHYRISWKLPIYLYNYFGSFWESADCYDLRLNRIHDPNTIGRRKFINNH
ncbi:hypothetical protein JW877_04135 [bacterium]|nr:hypothetical protein [bacterium]